MPDMRDFKDIMNVFARRSTSSRLQVYQQTYHQQTYLAQADAFYFICWML